MDDPSFKFIGDNSPEDVKWLCSLSDSELDLLISLKMLAIQRAKVVGHESLAKKFDLKTLRALGFVLMQHVKGQVEELQFEGVTGSKDFMRGCNFLALDPKDNGHSMGSEDLTTLFGMHNKKQTEASRSSEIAPDLKDRKMNGELSTPRLKKSRKRLREERKDRAQEIDQNHLSVWHKAAYPIYLGRHRRLRR